MKERVMNVRVEDTDGWNAIKGLASTRVGPVQRSQMLEKLQLNQR